MKAVADQSRNVDSLSQCNTLHDEFPKDTYIRTAPLSSKYEAILNEYLTVTTRLDATCFIQPKSADQVSRIVSILVHDQCLFAVKSGGALLNPGYNDIAHGVTINLSQMSSICLSSDQATVSIQAGAQWGSVYQTLDPLGYTVAGARNTNIGVLGQTLVGGQNNFNTRLGWTFDTVINFQIVLANGSLITSSANQNADLFKALKGGGQSNFGIITSIDIATIKIGALWGGLFIYNFSEMGKLYRPAVEWSDQAAKYPDATFVISWTNNATTGTTSVANYYQSTDDAAGKGYYTSKSLPTLSSHFPEALEEFAFKRVGIPTANTLRIDTPYDFATEINAESNQRVLIGNVYFKNDATVFANVDRIAQEVLGPYINRTKGCPYSNIQVEYQAQPRIIDEISQRKGGNVLGLHRIRENLLQFLVLVDWVDPSKDQVIQDLINEILTRVTAYTKSVSGGFADFQYAGTTNNDQDPLGSYGQDSIDYLKQISKRYDPTQVFQTLVPGGYKLADAGKRKKQYNFNQFYPQGAN